MKKNILIALLLVVSITSIIYANIKSNEASQVQTLELEVATLQDQASMMQRAAEEAAAEARLQFTRAAEAAEMARQAEADAHKALMECQSK